MAQMCIEQGESQGADDTMTPETQAAIRDSFHKALPAILEGKDPQPIVWGWDGKLQAWDRAPAKPWGSSEIITILAAVCETALISSEALLSRSRARCVVRPRQVACAIIKEMHPAMSLSEIGLFVGYIDHTTVTHSLRMIRRLLGAKDRMTQHLYHETKRKLAR